MRVEHGLFFFFFFSPPPPFSLAAGVLKSARSGTDVVCHDKERTEVQHGGEIASSGGGAGV